METHNQKLVRLLLQGRMSKTRIAETCGASRNKVIRWSKKLAKLGQDWEPYKTLSDQEIEQMINPAKFVREVKFVEPDWDEIERELARGQITMKGLYEEYREALDQSARPISLSQFYEVLKTRRQKNNIEMHFAYAPGEIAQFDFVGKRPDILFDSSGDFQKYDIAVAVSCASRYIFVEAIPSQGSEHVITCVSNMCAFFGGVHSTLIIDNFKAAVVKSRTKSSAPVINPRFQAVADHYGFVVAPARAYHARDKGMVEGSVRIVENDILGKLRHRRFYNLSEMNEAIKELLKGLNDRPMKGHGGLSRSQLFENNDRQGLLPLPAKRYEDGEWFLNRTVRSNLTFEVEGNHYSTPERFIGKKVNTKITSTSIFVYHENRQVAVHVRVINKRGVVTILDIHRPANHQYMLEGRLKQCVQTVSHIGPNCIAFMEAVHAAHYRSPRTRDRAWEVVQLAEKLGIDIIEKSADIANQVGKTSVGELRSIANALAKRPFGKHDIYEDNPPPSGNVRGADYFDKKRNKGGSNDN